MQYRDPISRLITKFLPCLLCAQTLVSAPFEYVTNRTDNTVSVIDTATNTIAKTVTVGHRPTDIAITPNGYKVYVYNSLDGTLSVINATNNTVVGDPIPIGGWLTSIAITPDGSKAYVCSADTSFADNIDTKRFLITNSVIVIDTTTDTVIEPIIHVGSNPRDIAFTPNGEKAYVCNADDNTVSVIDTATNTVIDPPIPVGSYPVGIAITPDGAKAYVCNGHGNSISVIKVANNTLIGSIPTALSPTCIAITPDGAKAYLSTSHYTAMTDKESHADDLPCIFPDEKVLVIDTATDAVIGTPIFTGLFPSGIAITPDGTSTYVCNSLSSNVSVIDTATDTIARQAIPVGHYPTRIAIGPSPILPSTPRKFVGTIERLSGSSWRKTTLCMQWKKSSSADVDHYEIFGSGRLIASIPASAPPKFHKRLHPYVRGIKLSKKYLLHLHDKYRIRAVSSSGTASSFKKLEIITVRVTKNYFSPTLTRLSSNLAFMAVH